MKSFNSLWGLTVLTLMMSPKAHSADVLCSDSDDLPKHAYFLEFDRSGELIHKRDLDRALHNLEQQREDPNAHQPVKIVLMSVGWSHERDSAVRIYPELIRFLRNNYDKQGNAIRMKKIAASGMQPQDRLDDYFFFFVCWDSSHRGVNRLLNDLLPGHQLADCLAWVPDKILFPFTFWAKADLAEDIGYNGLRKCMNYFLQKGFTSQEDREQTQIFMIGHSFGCRILSGFARKSLMTYRLKNTFQYNDCIKGAVFIQPAMGDTELPRDPEFPIVVTQSEHDHANGFLYPLGSLLLPAFTSNIAQTYTKEETRVRRTTVLNDVLQAPVSLVCSCVRLGAKSSQPRPVTSQEGPLPATPEIVIEEMAKPVLPFVWNVVALPGNYLLRQVHQISRRGLHYPFDTLAHTPLAGGLVTGFDELIFQSRMQWGKYHKGMFSLGSMNDSIADPTTKEYRWAFVPLHLVLFVPEYLRNQIQELSERTIRPVLSPFKGFTDVPAQAWQRGIGLFNHPIDTVAQVPVVKRGVEGFDQQVNRRILGATVSWGKEHKGFIDTANFNPLAKKPLQDIFMFTSSQNTATSCTLDKFSDISLDNKIVYVDCSKTIKNAWYGDMTKGPWRYLLPKLDPVGAHCDYQHEEIAELIHRVLESPRPPAYSLSQPPSR